MDIKVRFAMKTVEIPGHDLHIQIAVTGSCYKGYPGSIKPKLKS
jgi:hypothetical protein